MLVSEQQIDLTLPSVSVKMLIVQPHLDFQIPLQEPFPVRPECRDRLIKVVDNVFSSYGTFSPQLILFPEFALPGVEGVERVAGHMLSNEVASPTVVIGGFLDSQNLNTSDCAHCERCEYRSLECPRPHRRRRVGQYVGDVHQGQ